MAHAVAILPSRLVSTIPRTCDGLHDNISRVANLHVASMSTRSSDMACFEDDDPAVGACRRGPIIARDRLRAYASAWFVVRESIVNLPHRIAQPTEPVTLTSSLSILTLPVMVDHPDTSLKLDRMK